MRISKFYVASFNFYSLVYPFSAYPEKFTCTLPSNDHLSLSVRNHLKWPFTYLHSLPHLVSLHEGQGIWQPTQLGLRQSQSSKSSAYCTNLPSLWWYLFLKNINFTIRNNYLNVIIFISTLLFLLLITTGFLRVKILHKL